MESEDSSDDENQFDDGIDFDNPVERISDQQQPSAQSNNEDKTSKAGVIWAKLHDGDEIMIRIENSKACYSPCQFLTIDEHLLPLKCRCSFL